MIEVGRNVTNFEHRSHSNFFHQKYPQKTRKTKESLNVQVRMSSFDLQIGNRVLSIHCHAASRTFVCQSVNVIACCQLYSTYARVRGGGGGRRDV